MNVMMAGAHCSLYKNMFSKTYASKEFRVKISMAQIIRGFIRKWEDPVWPGQHNRTHPKQHNFIYIKCLNKKITYIAFLLIFTVQVVEHWHKEAVGLPPSEAT